MTSGRLLRSTSLTNQSEIHFTGRVTARPTSGQLCPSQIRAGSPWAHVIGVLFWSSRGHYVSVHPTPPGCTSDCPRRRPASDVGGVPSGHGVMFLILAPCRFIIFIDEASFSSQPSVIVSLTLTFDVSVSVQHVRTRTGHEEADVQHHQHSG